MSKRTLGIVSLALVAAASTTFVLAAPDQAKDANGSVSSNAYVVNGANRAIKDQAEAAARAAGTFQERKAGDPLAKQVAPRVTPAPAGGMATIQYDNGTMTGTPAASSFCYGNRFNTVNSNPLVAAGNVTGAQFYMVSVSGGASFVSWFDQLNTGAATANFIASVNKTGLAPGWNTVTTSRTYAGNSILAGVWYFGSDVPALGTGTNAGQGHHGMMINDISGNSYSALAGMNGLFRIMGNPLPVELTTFSVD